ncbi:meiosis-specific nuclear structural protein 1 [Haematobia irritans]|uniref:meiosis-specific nuclear structural protein 1 n=1 Tax=Haematobia irritans TaxID=7368 RepID=UPI003F4F53C9
MSGKIDVIYRSFPGYTLQIYLLKMSFRCISDSISKKNPDHENYFQKYVIDEGRRAKTSEIRKDQKTNEHQPPSTLNSICKELRDYKHRDIVDQKRRQQLRQESHELRLLQNQLKSAFVSKQLAEQKEEQQRQKEMEKQRKREEDSKWIAECERSKELLRQQEENERRKKESIRDLLQTQMKEMQTKRRNEIESVMKDREEMERTLKNIQAEEQAERDLAQRFRSLCRKEMEECVRNREIQRQLEKEQNVDESERLMEFQRLKDKHKDQMEAEKKQLLAQKVALSEKIGFKLAEINKEKKNREDLLLSLLIEERKAKEDVKYRQNIERKIREQANIRAELEMYRKEIAAQKLAKIQEEERKLREDFMRQMAERDKLDQLSNENRRRKIVEHSKALREMIDLRRKQRAEEIAERIGEFERSLKTEQNREQRIEEERIHILQSTPKELLKYLPPGTLKPSDREFLSIQPEKY